MVIKQTSVRAEPGRESHVAGRRSHKRGKPSPGDRALARGLGWFSIGLGVTEVLAPRFVGRLVGTRRDHPILVRALGLREIASGIGILANPGRPANALWSRVAGDAVDLSLLGVALVTGSSPLRVLAATASVCGVAALDVLAAVRHSGSLRTVRVVRSVAINRAPDECYAFWRDLENLPRFMRHVESVRVEEGRRSHWVVRGPAGRTVEWDAELVRDEPGSFIAWRSVGGDVQTEGSVQFAARPGGRGTLLRVSLEYGPPAGAAGALVAKLFVSEPDQQIREDLHRLKQLLETGEIPTTEGQPAGRREVVHRSLARLFTGGVS